MSGGACVQLLGLLLDIVGVGLFSVGEVANMAALAHTLGVQPGTSLYEQLPHMPWYRRIPLRLAARHRPSDPRSLDSPLMETFPPKFWGLVLIILGFLLQAMAVLGGP
jgi:hypothetical protein